MKVLLSTIPSFCYATFLMITGVTITPVIIMNIALLNLVCPFLLKGSFLDISNIHKEILSSFVFLLLALANVVFPQTLALGYGFVAAKIGITINSVMYLALMLTCVVDILVKNCMCVKYLPTPSERTFSRQDPIDPAQLGLMNSAEKQRLSLDDQRLQRPISDLDNNYQGQLPYDDERPQSEVSSLTTDDYDKYKRRLTGKEEQSLLEKIHELEKALEERGRTPLKEQFEKQKSCNDTVDEGIISSGDDDDDDDEILKGGSYRHTDDKENINFNL